ncbi:hypothetical protein ACFQXA_15600 [Nocardiopsis composta]
MRLREVLSALTGTAFLIGVPLLLSRAGWPLSGVDAGEVAMFLRGGALPARLLAAGLITLAWAAWGCSRSPCWPTWRALWAAAVLGWPGCGCSPCWPPAEPPPRQRARPWRPR